MKQKHRESGRRHRLMALNSLSERLLTYKLVPLIIFFLTFAGILINGYAFGTDDSALRGAMRELRADSSLFKGDPTMGQSDNHVSYVDILLTPFYKTFGVEHTSFFAYVIVHYAIYLSLYYLARSMFSDPRVALLSVIFLLIDKPSMGSHTLFPLFGERLFALPFLIMAFMFFFRKRYILASLMAGIATDLHLYTGAAVFLMFGMYLSYKELRSQIFQFGCLVKMTLVYLTTSLPVIVWILSQPSSMSFIMPEFLLKIMKLIVVHHYFILSWYTPMYIDRWIRFFVFFALLLVAYRHVSSTTSSKKDMHDAVKGFFWVICIFFLLIIIFTYVIPLTYVMNLQLVRTTHWIIFIGGIYLSKFIADKFKASDLFSKAVLAGISASFFLGNFKGILISLIFFLADRFRLRGMRWRFLTVAAGGAAALGISVLASFVPLSNISFLKLGTLSVFVVALSLTGTLLIEVSRTYKPQLPRALLFIALIVAVLILTSIGAINLRYTSNFGFPGLYELALIGPESPSPVSLKAIDAMLKEPRSYLTANVQYRYEFPRNDWEDIQQWARQQTNKDDIFITPPYLSGFRMYSLRPVVGEWLDVNTAVLDIAYAGEIWERMTDLCDSEIFSHCDGEYGFTCSTFCGLQYNKLDEGDFSRIAGKYNASYVVVEKPKALSLALAYENEGFRIYKSNKNNIIILMK